MSEAPIKMDLSGDVTPLFEGLKANLETAPRGFQKLFVTLFGKKYADQMYYQILQAAQAHVDVSKVFTGEARFVDGKLIYKDENALPTMLEVKNTEENENLAGCAIEAIKESLGHDEQGEDSPISEKFFARWRSEAIYAASYEERQLWGKILSQESHQPGSFSLRTLDILKNMDRDTGLLFERACDYVVFDKKILINIDKDFGDSANAVYSLNRVDLDVLSNLGLISGVTLADVQDPKDKKIVFAYANYYIIIETENKIHPAWCSLTDSGKQLYKIARVTNKEKVRNFCRFILSQNAISNLECVQFYDAENPVMVSENMVQTERVTI